MTGEQVILPGSSVNLPPPNFANEVTAGIDFIKSRKDLKYIPLGLIGHSEGGMIARMIASADSRVGLIVLLAGPGIPLDKLLLQQAAYGQTSRNVPKDIGAIRPEQFSL
jgi:pimeloyl-ACP methyl ester carboxylesterase